MAKFVPSPYQIAGFRWVEMGRGSAIMVAVAGSGKTTFSVHALLRIPEHKYVTMLAFNNSAAKTMNVKIDELRKDEENNPTGRQLSRVSAKTFHSLGYGAVMKRINRRADPDDKKLYKLFDQLWPSKDVQEMYSSYVCKLVSFAKGVGIGVLGPNDFGSWWGLTRHHDMYLEHQDATEEEAIGMAQQLLKESNLVAEEHGSIDFDDMLYLPLLWNLNLFQVDWVIVDEAQDTNPVRRALVKKILRAGGRSMWVGDPKQSIYGFTGASVDAMDVIKHEFNCQELPLTVSYRCCRAVGDKARTLVDYFETHEAAPQGLVEEMSLEQALEVLDNHDAILCRNTAPLIETAYDLIARGIGCVVLGREIGQGLVALINKQQTNKIDVLEKKLELWRERQVEKFMSKGEEQKADGINDKVQCIITIINHNLDARDVEDLKNRIMRMFSDSNGVLTLSTQHKAKGREWRRVAILAPELNPSKWARQDWQVEQEQNLMYVAWTRAMEHLIFIGKAKEEKKDEGQDETEAEREVERLVAEDIEACASEEEE